MSLNYKARACGTAVVTLFIVDYMLGHELLDTIRKTSCKMICSLKKIIKEESRIIQATPDPPINFPVLIVEIVLLFLLIIFLNKYKTLRSKDPIEELLKKSRDSLKQANEYLEKWRLKQMPLDYTYLKEDLDPNAMKVEVPVLRMAILDSFGFQNNGEVRNYSDRYDAGDSVDMSDSALLSMTSLVSDDFDYKTVSEPMLGEKLSEVAQSIEFRNRYLWDVMEEDGNVDG